MATAARTPSVAIARTLRELGLKQGEDFRIKGQYRGRGAERERVATYVAVLTPKAEQIISDHADHIERVTETESGFVFLVSVHYTAGGRMWTWVSNSGPRVRDERPAATADAAGAPLPDTNRLRARELRTGQLTAADVKREQPAYDPEQLIGRIFFKSATHHRNGFPEGYRLTVHVEGLVAGFTDPWTHDRHDVGVRFTILDESRGWRTYHVLSLADFRKHWAPLDAPEA